MYRLIRLVAVIILASAGTLVSVTSPAVAAPALFIRNSFAHHCLDQHYSASGVPTIQVYAVPGPCHWAGNQQWRMEPLGANTFTLANSRNDDWCLSAPNGATRQVFAELCTGAPKQVWGASTTVLGFNLIVSQLWGTCMYNDPFTSTDVWLAFCQGDNHRHNWYWSAEPSR